MRTWVALAALATWPGRAAAGSPADPDPVAKERYYGGLALAVGASQTWLFGGGLLEAGYRIPRVPIATRVDQSDRGGDWTRYGGGIEVRGGTAGGYVCGFLGLDLAYQVMTLHDINGGGRLVDERRGPVLGPRFGLDVGGRVRFRAAIEILRFKTHRDPPDWIASSDLVLGIVYQR